MAPIRIVLLGLSQTSGDDLGAGTWGANAHVKPLLENPHYDLVGICNSSKASSEASIAFHKLPPSVKAYDSPGEVAADPDVDMAAVSVNVVKHHAIVKTLLKGGKKVFVEWPLASNMAQNEELASLAKEKGVGTVLGTQLRADPVVKRVKELLAKNAIGEVINTVVSGCSSPIAPDMWLDGAEYYLSMESGGNEYMIFFGHFLDTFISTLGGFSSFTPLLKQHYKTVPTLNPATGKVVNPSVPKNVPDHIFLQGTLASGAAASIAFRKALKPVDATGLRWTITGTEGEIEVVIPEDHLQMGHPGRTLKIRRGREEVEAIKYEEDGEAAYIKSISPVGRNTARTYEEFATGGDGFADFGEALETHKLLQKILDVAKWNQ